MEGCDGTAGGSPDELTLRRYDRFAKGGEKQLTAIDEICENWQLGKVFNAGMGEHTRTKLLKGWKKAVKCALLWAEEE